MHSRAESGSSSAQAPTGRHQTGARSGLRRALTSRQRCLVLFVFVAGGDFGDARRQLADD